MKDNENLVAEKIEIKERLVKTGKEIEEHLKSHGGKILSSCHKCISYTLEIKIDRLNLDNIQKKIGD